MQKFDKTLKTLPVHIRLFLNPTQVEGDSLHSPRPRSPPRGLAHRTAASAAPHCLPWWPPASQTAQDGGVGSAEPPRRGPPAPAPLPHPSGPRAVLATCDPPTALPSPTNRAVPRLGELLPDLPPAVTYQPCPHILGTHMVGGRPRGPPAPLHWVLVPLREWLEPAVPPGDRRGQAGHGHPLSRGLPGMSSPCPSQALAQMSPRPLLGKGVGPGVGCPPLSRRRRGRPSPPGREGLARAQQAPRESQGSPRPFQVPEMTLSPSCPIRGIWRDRAHPGLPDLLLLRPRGPRGPCSEPPPPAIKG